MLNKLEEVGDLACNAFVEAIEIPESYVIINRNDPKDSKRHYTPLGRGLVLTFCDYCDLEVVFDSETGKWSVLEPDTFINLVVSNDPRVVVRKIVTIHTHRMLSEFFKKESEV